MLHCVSYDCSNFYVNQFLRNAVEARRIDPKTGPPPPPPIPGQTPEQQKVDVVDAGPMGRLHLYSTSSENEFYGSTDVLLLLAEIKKAQEILKHIEKLRQGLLSALALVRLALF